MAYSLGASHTINTKDFSDLTGDLADAIKTIEAQGSNYIIETTGVLPIAQAGIRALAPRGQLLIIGIPGPGQKFDIEHRTILSVSILLSLDID
jgi:Zn-dependent alcohol dehydrogenase